MGNLSSFAGPTLAGLFSSYFIVILILLALPYICRWRMLEKAGSPGWASIVPFYGTYLMFENVWDTKYFFLELGLPILIGVLSVLSMVMPAGLAVVIGLLSGIALLGLFAINVIFAIHVARAYGMGSGYAALILISPLIGYAIIAFGDSEYVGNTSNYTN